MNFNIFNRKTLNIPEQSPARNETESTGANIIQSFYKDTSGFGSFTSQNILEMNTGYAGICSNIVAQSIATQPFKIYIAKNKSKKIAGYIDVKKINNIDEFKKTINKSTVQMADEIYEIVNSEHPVIKLLNDVNPYMSKTDLFKITQIYLDIIGNAFWYLKMGKNNIPEEIYPLLSEYMKIKIKNNKISGYEYQVNNSKRTFTPEEIIHFKYLNTGDLIVGRGSLYNVLIDTERMKYYNIYESALAKNNGRPDFILKYGNKTGAKLDEKSKLELEKMLNNRYGRTKNNGKPLVSDSDFEIITLGFPTKELQFIEGRQDARQIICSAFGVPESFLVNKEVNRANIDGAEYIYAKYTLFPKLTIIQEVLNEYLFTIYDDSIFMKYENPVIEDIDKKIKYYEFLLKNDLITKEEIKTQLGL